MNEILEMIQNYAASGKYKRVPVSRELYADAFTPISVMRTLRAASRHCYLLESAAPLQAFPLRVVHPSQTPQGFSLLPTLLFLQAAVVRQI